MVLPPLLQIASQLRRYAFHKPPKLLVFLFQFCDLKLLLDAAIVFDLFFKALVLLRQIVDGGLILFHLPQMAFKPGEIRNNHRKDFLSLFPCIHHCDFRQRLFDGSLLLRQRDRLLEQPCRDMLASGDKGALAPFENGKLLFHVGVELVLPFG